MAVMSNVTKCPRMSLKKKHLQEFYKIIISKMFLTIHDIHVQHVYPGYCFHKVFCRVWYE